MKTLIRSFIITSILVTFAASLAWAGEVTISNTFIKETPALADEVNENFDDVEDAVNDNNTRISSNATDIGTSAAAIANNASNIANNTEALNNLQLTRTMSFPASALSFNPASTIITSHRYGLLWQFNYLNSANLLTRAPSDYAGGNVTFHIFFQTTTATAGVVQFFIRPRSWNSGDGMFDASSLSDDPVNVTGTIGFGTMYEQSFVIPESSLTKDWWYTTMQRDGSAATYTDDVIVFGVAYEYSAVQ